MRPGTTRGMFGEFLCGEAGECFFFVEVDAKLQFQMWR